MKVILTHVVELDTAPTFTAHVSADGVAHARHLVSLMKDANTRAITLKPHDGTIIKLIIDSVTIIYQPATSKHIYIIPSAMTGDQLKAWKFKNCDWSM